MTLKSLSEYSKGFQIKVIGALLTDKKFILNVRDVLKPEYFDSPAHQWIIQQIIDYYDTYHTTVNMETLKIQLKKVENDVLKVAIKEELRNSYQVSQDDLEFVEEEFTLFCRNQEMKRAILVATEKLKQNDFEGIRTLIENALKAGIEKGIGHEYKKDVETRYRDDYRPTIPTPWEPINQLFAGGLGPGDLFLIFGGPGAGKSWISIAIAANAVKLGYNVFYYSLELGESYVARRFDSYLTGYSVEECKERRAEIDQMMKDLPGNLIVKEYPPKSATLSTIEAHAQKCIAEGINPDLIIIDYGDYIKSGKGHYGDIKAEVDDNYVGMKGLAKTLGVPVISPSQVNRMGAKDKVVEGDKAAGSYDKMMVADGAMSLSRQKEDKVLGTGRVHIMKNRYGEDGLTYEIRFDTSNGHIDFENNIESVSAGGSENPFSVNISSDVLQGFFNK